MGQKVRPTGFRTGIMESWRSTWYANKKDFGDLLVEDHQIREFITRKYKTSKGRERLKGISKIVIERTREKVAVLVFTAKPGMIIGQKGAEIERLTRSLERLVRRVIEVKTIEVHRPETDAQCIAGEIAEQLERRTTTRRCRRACRSARRWRTGRWAARSSSPAGSAARKWPGSRRGWTGASRCPRCGRGSATASPRRAPRKGTLASRFGQITGTT